MQLSFITGMSVKTIIDWANFVRDVLKQHVYEEIQVLHLKGTIEVDESLCGRRVKFHRCNPNRGVKVT